MYQQYLDDEGNSTGGFASVGYSGPSARQQALMDQSRRWNAWAQTGGQVPMDQFETASEYNDRAAARQQSHNMKAAAQFMSGQRQNMDDAPPSQFSVLDRQYSQSKPSFARYGNEVSINGQQVTNDLGAAAQAQGMDADSYANSLYEKSKRDFAQQQIERRKGNVRIGTSESKLFQDPRFHELSPEEQDSLSEHVHGFKYSDALNADKMGGNMTLSQYQSRRMAPERQKASFDYLKGIESVYGANAGEILGNYDPKTQSSTIPGSVKLNRDGEPVELPPRVIKMPAAMFEQLRQQQAYLSGFGTSGEMDMADPANRLAALEARRAQEMASVPQQPSRRVLGGTPELDARKQAAIKALQLRQVEAAGASAYPQARQFFDTQEQKSQEAEAMKYWKNRNSLPAYDFASEPVYGF